MATENFVRKAQPVLNPMVCEILVAVLLLCFPVFGQTYEETAKPPESPTPATFNVPDESVIPQWRRILNDMVQARESHFAQYHAKLTPPSNALLTDQELITGAHKVAERTPVLAPQLEGAEGCNIVWSASVMDSYTCYFEPTGPSAEDMQKDFIKLVRLVEKATGTTARMLLQPEASPTWEHRSVMCGRVFVGAFWELHPKAVRGVLARSNSHLAVSVTITFPINAEHTLQPAESEIDTALKSGSYTPLPPIQRIRSSGYGPASINIKNDTGYSLTIVYEGQSGTTVTVPAHQTSTVSVSAGSYRVMGRVSAPNVLPFIGDQSVGPGDLLETSFYIANH